MVLEKSNLSLLEYFAGQALVGFTIRSVGNTDFIVRSAWATAQVMIEQHPETPRNDDADAGTFTTPEVGRFGVSLLEYFAGQALVGVTTPNTSSGHFKLAQRAWEIAEKMVEGQLKMP